MHTTSWLTVVVQTERREYKINMAPPQKKKKKTQKPESQRRSQHKDLAIAGDTKQAQFKTKANSERRGVPQGDLPD